MLTTNMNIRPSKKDGFSPEEVGKKALQSERFKTVYNMHRLEKMHKLNLRQDRYGKKKYVRKRKKLRENLNIGEKVYVLAERIKKKSAPEKFSVSSKNTLFQQRHSVYHKKKTSHRQYKILLGKKFNV